MDDPLLGRTLAGKFVIESLLGSGSTGSKTPAVPPGGGGAQQSGAGSMNAMTAALEPSVGGQILYFNIQ